MLCPTHSLGEQKQHPKCLSKVCYHDKFLGSTMGLPILFILPGFRERLLLNCLISGFEVKVRDCSVGKVDSTGCTVDIVVSPQTRKIAKSWDFGLFSIGFSCPIIRFFNDSPMIRILRFSNTYIGFNVSAIIEIWCCSNRVSAIIRMALRGFSGFEAMFRRNMAKKVIVGHDR